MKKIWPWILGLSVLLILAVIVLFGTRFMSFRNMPYEWERTDQFGFDRSWHHHGRGMHWGFHGLPFMGLLGLFLMLLVPFGLLALVVLGIVSLVRALGSNESQPDKPTSLRCGSCGKQVDPDWSVCAYCGEPLGGE